MNTIIHDILIKITKDIENNVENLILNRKDISEFVQSTSKSLDAVGKMIIKGALETLDELTRDSKDRKKEYYIQRRNDPKTLITKFGEVNYQRTYYKNKKNGSYRYLSDEIVGIVPYERMDLSYEAALIDEAIQTSYQRAGKEVSENVEVSKQTVMNSIRRMGNVENSSVKIVNQKKVVKTIFIEADEDHVAMQHSSNKEIKLIYVHEGKRLVSKGRYELINKRYFTGSLNKSEDLWLEVADYLDKAYDLDNVKNIYLSGDGARWIKEGLNWIQDSIYVLDYFHLSKYVREATAHMPECFHSILWNYINKLDKKSTTEMLNIIIDKTEKETKKEAVKKCKRYILNNWEGIKRRYDKEYIGCSAEGHISHILSDRLSSRPLGWSLIGADQMARLRVYDANGGDIYELMKRKKKETKKEQRLIELEKRIVKTKINAKISINNIPYINDGRSTWQRNILKSLRGA